MSRHLQRILWRITKPGQLLTARLGRCSGGGFCFAWTPGNPRIETNQHSGRRTTTSSTTYSSTPPSKSAPGPRLPGTEGRKDDGDENTTHFGFQQVRVEEKESRVQAVFDSVADSYDIMNDLMSGGLHRMWKDHVASASNVREMAVACRKHQLQNRQELRILDVAGGTGDLSFRFVDAAECWVRAGQQ
jgi:hypothetical protein